MATSRSSAEPRAPRAAALAWAGAAAAAGAALAGLEPNLLEEGAHLHVAERLADGERLYRDVLFFTGPLPFELLALLFRVLGEEILVARGAVVLLQAVATAATYALAVRARAGALAHVAAAALATAPVLGFPMLSVYFYTTLAFYAVPPAAYAALRALESQRWAIALGVILACVGLCKQTLGLALSAALLLGLTALAPRGARLLRFGGAVLGACAVGGLVLGAYAATGGIGDLVRAIVVMPLSLSDRFGLPFPNLWPPGRFEEAVARSAYLYVPKLYFVLSGRGDVLSPTWLVGVTQGLYAVPFAVLLLTPLTRLRGPVPPALLLHAAGLLALATNLYPRPDWGHLLFVLPAALAHLALLVPLRPGEPTRPPTPERIARSRRAVAAAAAGALVAAGAAGSVALWRASGEPSFGARVPLRPVSPSYKDSNLPRVIEYLRERVEPGEPIFVARQEPLLYFATGTRNPTPYVGALSGFHEEQERTILRALENVRFVVMSEIDQAGYHWYAEDLPAVYAHLERHFRVPRDLHPQPGDWITVYVRGRDRGPTLVDLYRARLEGEPWVRPWLRNGDGVERSYDEPAMKIASQHLRRPLAIPVAARGSGVDFDLVIPEDAAFQSAIGLRFLRTPVGHRLHPVGAFMRVSIRTAGKFEELYRGRISTSPSAGLHWRPVEVDLGAYGGRRATLRLEVLPQGEQQAGMLAWWGSPRLARPPGSP